MAERILSVTSNEIEGSATFTVSLSALTRKPVVLTYQTSDDSATAGADYTTITDTLTIPAQTGSGFITIPVNSDFIDEESESFTVTLTGATDGTLGDADATATIIATSVR